MSESIEPRKPELILKAGAHPEGTADCCLIEHAHRLRGKPKQAKPLEDESPVLVAALISFNDSFGTDDAERTKYGARFVPRVAGSKGSIEIDVQRAWIAADWLVRIYAPICFEQLDETKGHVEALRATARIIDAATLKAALKVYEPAALAALAARAARAALEALAALDARAADPKATEDEKYEAAAVAATKFYLSVTARIRESEVDMLERMFALTEKKASES